jgi:hypothetical protein
VTRNIDLEKHVNPVTFLQNLRNARTPADIEALLATIPISSVDYDSGPLDRIWEPGKLHWLPVGGDRGNAGRIKLANNPVNPLAERLINGMEAIIELARQREIKDSPGASPPESPRSAVLRYFDLPPLDALPGATDFIRGKKPFDHARELARRLRVRLQWVPRVRQFCVLIEDDGVGQPPDRVHSTLLSLGATTKADKAYLIGVFGQGGSSTYAASEVSWIMSRRSPDLLGQDEDGIGWTVVKHVFPRGRRDDYWAYLAADRDGRIPRFGAAVADQLGLKTGTTFSHLNYNFGRGGSSIARNLFPALNHVLFNPILPYEIYAGKDTPDLMWGNSYRLASLKDERRSLDKRFGPQTVSVTN